MASSIHERCISLAGGAGFPPRLVLARVNPVPPLSTPPAPIDCPPEKLSLLRVLVDRISWLPSERTAEPLLFLGDCDTVPLMGTTEDLAMGLALWDVTGLGSYNPGTFRALPGAIEVVDRLDSEPSNWPI